MKSTLRALCLVLVLVWTNASELDCVGLNKTLGQQELHKIEGDWVLVWMVNTVPNDMDLLPNFTNSHLEIRLLPDNKTLHYLERNVYQGGRCATYHMNLTFPEGNEQRSLVYTRGTEHKDGVVRLYNDSATLDFLKTSDLCMKLVYDSQTVGRFLLIYSREGHHREVLEELKKEQSDHRKLAECLGLPLDKVWTYDGVSDFCHKKSAPDQTES